MKIIEPVTITDGGYANASADNMRRTYFDRDGKLQTAGPNQARITYDFEDLDAAPYLMVEPAATKCLGQNTASAMRNWPGYTTGSATLSYSVVSDARFGDVLRITKTGGDVGDAAGIQLPSGVQGLAGTNLTASVYLRRGTDTAEGRALYVDAALNDGRVNIVSAGFGLDSPRDWHRYVATGGDASPMNGAGNAYIWISSQVGDFIDVVLPDVEVGPTVSSAVKYEYAAPYMKQADVVSGAGTMVYSNLPEESTVLAYSSAAAYAVGARAYRASTHRIYECLIASTGFTPEDNTAGVTPRWMDVGATNQRAAFDNIASAPTVAPGGVIHYVLQAGRTTNALAAISMDATEIRVAVTDRFGAVKYQKSVDLRSRQVSGWRDWFFKAFIRRRDVVFSDLPQYTGGLITVAITKGTNQVSVGELTVGHMETLGEVQWKPEVRVVDYSRKDTDKFGNTTFIKRRNAKIISCDIFIENTQVDEVVRLLSLYTATPLTWIGDENYGSLIIFGFAQDFRVVLDSPGGSYLNLQIQGLT